ncbi:hypothetical protein C7974DRAFT_379699 [Boeremia exigua]|uniref:uncharacterized protein n=1 Tax=Boeremia exigua TaxID=749465 RepID=UPI001E8E91AC|nr:uncharacterized protein C7974DRAFT_379699 [Boeremia exigua]KAH6616863.1 hypothetical protein C7974DRAFT_379699 [Boeremia exigua]
MNLPFSNIKQVQGLGEWQTSSNEHVQDAIGLRSIDVSLQISDSLQYNSSLAVDLPNYSIRLTQVPGLIFLDRVIKSTAALAHNSLSLRLFYPAKATYVSWAGAFEMRMTDCPLVDLSFNTFQPLQRLDATCGTESYDTLSDIFTKSVAGVLLQTAPANLPQQLCELDDALLQRLSLPWLSPTPVRRKTLAIIEGGFNYDFRQLMLNDAHGLGIDVVILDQESHWLNCPSYQHLRRAFLAMDMTLDSDLPSRIVRTLEAGGIPIDGLTSFSDSYLVATASAAEILKLPTSPSTALEKVVDKDKCRRSLSSQPKTFCCSSEKDLRQQLNAISHVLPFPLIVKPTQGGGSQGVVKVRNEQELYSALNRTSNHMGGQVVVEPYIDGPEIDANFILHRGEILFCEISDNFPCAGDLPNASISDSFLETRIIFPSALDQVELDLAKRQLHQVLLDLGFSSGVFHVEARIDKSSKHYALGEDGTVDLHHKLVQPSSEARVFLIEVNARCPGRQALSAVARSYGVDYYMMQLLLAIGDTARTTALCQPFLGGCQYQCCEAVYIPARTGGIFDSGNLKDELLERRPDLASAIVEHHTLFQRGDVIPGPETGKLRWVATFLVASRRSRHDALLAGEIVESEVRYRSVPCGTRLPRQ